jgi:hypothetical protein
LSTVEIQNDHFTKISSGQYKQRENSLKNNPTVFLKRRNETTGFYAHGGQAAQVFALALNAAPTAEIKQKTVDYLVQNIYAHGNHTTCGANNVFFEPFLYTNDHFTKTGSGQT